MRKVPIHTPSSVEWLCANHCRTPCIHTLAYSATVLQPLFYRIDIQKLFGPVWFAKVYPKTTLSRAVENIFEINWSFWLSLNKETFVACISLNFQLYQYDKIDVNNAFSINHPVYTVCGREYVCITWITRRASRLTFVSKRIIFYFDLDGNNNITSQRRFFPEYLSVYS